MTTFRLPPKHGGYRPKHTGRDDELRASAEPPSGPGGGSKRPAGPTDNPAQTSRSTGD